MNWTHQQTQYEGANKGLQQGLVRLTSSRCLEHPGPAKDVDYSTSPWITIPKSTQVASPFQRYLQIRKTLFSIRDINVCRNLWGSLTCSCKNRWGSLRSSTFFGYKWVENPNLKHFLNIEHEILRSLLTDTQARLDCKCPVGPCRRNCNLKVSCNTMHSHCTSKSVFFLQTNDAVPVVARPLELCHTSDMIDPLVRF